MKLYILLAILLLSGCIGVKIGDDPKGSSLSVAENTSADIIFPENNSFVSLSPQRNAKFAESEIRILNSSAENIENFFVTDNIIKLYDVAPGWYSVYIDNSLKFKIKAVRNSKVFSFISYTTTIQDNGYIYVSQTIDSYSVSHFSGIYGREISKLSYTAKSTIFNNIFLSTDIKLYKNNTDEEITENMIDVGSAAVNTIINETNFSEIHEDHRKKILSQVTGQSTGYNTYTEFNSKLHNSKLDTLVISSVNVFSNSIVLNELTAGKTVDIELHIADRNTVSVMILNNNIIIYKQQNIIKTENTFIIKDVIIKNRYIKNGMIQFKFICTDEFSKVNIKTVEYKATSTTNTVDHYFSITGTRVINNALLFTLDTTKNSNNTSIRAPITSGYFYMKIQRKSDNALFYLPDFERSLYKDQYYRILQNVSTANTGVYTFERSFSEYGQYECSYFLENDTGDTSEIRYQSFRIAKTNEDLSDTTTPEFYFTFKNEYGGAAVFYNASNEVTVDTTKTTGGSVNGNSEKDLKIYVKIYRDFDGSYSERTQELSSANGIYYCYEKIKKTGYFNVTVSATDLAGNTFVQTSSVPIFIGQTDKIPPQFTATVTDHANNEDINVGDKVKLNINTTPNEGKAYVKAEVSSSGEVRSIYSERLVTFDENGNFTDVSSSSITSSYDNTSLVGVKFDVVIYVKDIAGNESVKYIPSIIKQ